MTFLFLLLLPFFSSFLYFHAALIHNNITAIFGWTLSQVNCKLIVYVKYTLVCFESFVFNSDIVCLHFRRTSFQCKKLFAIFQSIVNRQKDLVIVFCKMLAIRNHEYIVVFAWILNQIKVLEELQNIIQACHYFSSFSKMHHIGALNQRQDIQRVQSSANLPPHSSIII